MHDYAFIINTLREFSAQDTSAPGDISSTMGLSGFAYISGAEPFTAKIAKGTAKYAKERSFENYNEAALFG